MANDFAYEVAISFLDRDEPTATAIAAALKQTLKSFVYSERQAELVGNDGAEVFSNVFSRNTRIVVVLYREAWGQTKWTRIEETAIKNRVLNDGADFLTFIHLEKGKPTPAWLPQTQIWLDFERLGTQGAAAIIEERVAKAGAIIREETVTEYAARLKAEKNSAAQRQALLASPAGVDAATAAAKAIFDRLESLKGVGEYSFDRQQDVVAMYRKGYTVHVYWQNPYSNTLNGSRLIVREWDGRPNFGAHFYANVNQKPVVISEREFDFDVVVDEPCWREAATNRLFSSERIADGAVKQLLDLVRKDAGQRDRWV